ncbi:MAG: hypothetical protein R2824_06035 [Saprospiraceae bacterium]
MENSHDPLGIYQLTKELRELNKVIKILQQNHDPFIDLIPEVEFSKRVNISASTLRNWRLEGRFKNAWVKRGKYVLWSARLFQEPNKNNI